MADAGSVGPPAGPAGESLGKGRRKPWSPLEPADALIGIGAVIVSVSILGAIVIALVKGEPDQTLVGLVPQGLLFIGIPIAIASMRVASRPWRVMGYVPFKGTDLWLVAAVIGIQIVAFIAFSNLFFTPEQDTVVDDKNFDKTTLIAIAAVLLIVIVAPVTEETLFRGLFFGAIRSRAPFWVAAGISGVAFGAVHLGPGDPAVAGFLALFGVMLAWLYEKTGSLGPPIAAHMVNNSLAIIPLLS